MKNSTYLVNGQVKEEKEFQSALLNLANRYSVLDENLTAAIKSADYTARTLGDICLKINGGNASAVYQVSATEQSRFRLFAGAGINQGTLKFTGNSRYTGKNSYPFYFPVIGIGADIFSNPATKKLFVRNQLTATIYKTDAKAVSSYYEATENYSFKFRQVNISLHSQLSYNIYNQPYFQWYIGAGGGMNFSSYPLNRETMVKEPLAGPVITTEKDPGLEFIKKFWLNMSFRSGVTIKNFDCSLLFFPKSSITKNTASDLTNSSLQLQVNYIFN